VAPGGDADGPAVFLAATSPDAVDRLAEEHHDQGVGAARPRRLRRLRRHPHLDHRPPRALRARTQTQKGIKMPLSSQLFCPKISNTRISGVTLKKGHQNTFQWGNIKLLYAERILVFSISANGNSLLAAINIVFYCVGSWK